MGGHKPITQTYMDAPDMSRLAAKNKRVAKEDLIPSNIQFLAFLKKGV
jgi:hypothetical protein